MANDYIVDIINRGDDASQVIHSICKQTCLFRHEVSVADPSMGGLTVVRLNKDQKAAVHSSGGSPEITGIEDYVVSLVDNLANQARKIGAVPIAMTNTLDMSNIDLELVKRIGKALYGAAEQYEIAIVNGEIAGLGSRVGCSFNLSGTMLSAVPDSRESGTFKSKEIEAGIFSHENKPIYMNSDGVGTKIEIAERTAHHTNMNDLFAMLADDGIKKGAEVRYISSVLETKSKDIMLEAFLRSRGKKLAKQLNINFIMQAEKLGERVEGYGHSPYNLGGTCVSLIDERSIKNPPISKPGDFVVAIRNPSNPTFRSNGITKVREGLKAIYGEEWHREKFGEYRVGKLAGAPSTIFYPVFRELWDKNLASSFYHMSGGAHDGKFAHVLAKYGLHAEISNLFEPSPLMQKLVEHYKLAPAEAYKIWNMGNEGYITTTHLEDAITVLRKHGLEGKSVGLVSAARDKTGLTIKLSSGEVYYPGK